MNKTNIKFDILIKNIEKTKTLLEQIKDLFNLPSPNLTNIVRKTSDKDKHIYTIVSTIKRNSNLDNNKMLELIRQKKINYYNINERLSLFNQRLSYLLKKNFIYSDGKRFYNTKKYNQRAILTKDKKVRNRFLLENENEKSFKIFKKNTILIFLYEVAHREGLEPYYVFEFPSNEKYVLTKDEFEFIKE